MEQYIGIGNGRERYGTFPIFGETKNEYGAPAPAGKANGALLQRCKSRRVVRGTRRGSILLLLG